MSWETFYLGCFWIGFLFSGLSLLAGFGVLHMPGMHLHTGHGGGQNSPVNFGTIVIFLAWFGATGYLLTRYSDIWALLALGVASLSGLGGASAIFWLLVKVVLADEKELDPADYDMIGVLGRVSSSVRSGGTGEMIFSQAGTRRAAAIRSESGEAIQKGEEVVVTRFEKGVAWVRRWEEISEKNGPHSSGQKEN
jgi:membrane protein implicated in regulation of membrane protease activity